MEGGGVWREECGGRSVEGGVWRGNVEGRAEGVFSEEEEQVSEVSWRQRWQWLGLKALCCIVLGFLYL